MVFEQKVSFRINRAKKKGLRAKIFEKWQFLLVKFSLNAYFSPSWIRRSMYHTISESPGPDGSDEVWASFLQIHDRVLLRIIVHILNIKFEKNPKIPEKSAKNPLNIQWIFQKYVFSLVWPVSTKKISSNVGIILTDTCRENLPYLEGGVWGWPESDTLCY